MPNRSVGLKRRVTLWLVLYAALLSLAVFVHGFIVNERAEMLTWRSLLESEMEHFVERSAEDPRYQWTDTSTVQLYGDDDDSPPPPEFSGFLPGIHDDVAYQGRTYVLLVRDVKQRRLVLALDITQLQRHENRLWQWMLGSNLLAIVLLGLLVAWGLGRVIKPLSDMAREINELRPDKPGQRIESKPAASAEQHVISDALNDYLIRNDLFVERERAFIDSASHELRTPISVISGATELALEHPLSPPVRQQLLRIRQTISSVEQLISLLLVLAKDPARLARTSDYVRLDQLLPDIVADHRYLCEDKDLDVEVAAMPSCEVFAPMAIIQAAVGNLLRNALENSNRGVVTLTLEAPAVVTIKDPGHGMTPEEVSAIYARMARDQPRQGNGIGLELIARLCEHLGWRLYFDSGSGQGTVATLDMSHSVSAHGEGDSDADDLPRGARGRGEKR